MRDLVLPPPAEVPRCRWWEPLWLYRRRLERWHEERAAVRLAHFDAFVASLEDPNHKEDHA